MAKEFAGPDAELHACPVHAGARIAVVRLLSPADGGRSGVGACPCRPVWLCSQRRSLPPTPPATNATPTIGRQGLYAMKPNYAAHYLKKKTRKQHIAGEARATQIMVSSRWRSLYRNGRRSVLSWPSISPLFCGRADQSVLVRDLHLACTVPPVMSVTRHAPVHMSRGNDCHSWGRRDTQHGWFRIGP